METEAAGAVAVRSRVRVTGQQVEHHGACKQRTAVDRCQHDLDVETAHAVVPVGSVISVNSDSSSSVTRGTVCRMPSQQR